MEVHQARAFLAVAEHLHFGHAAAALHMAQPPLSRLIRRLETDLGAELFERSTRHVALTAQGAALVEPARELVRLSESMAAVVRESLDGTTGRVTLGFAGGSVNDLVGDLARDVRARRPGIDLELHSAQFSHVGLERVLAGELDVVLGRWDHLPPAIDSRLVATERLLVALPEGHRLAAEPAVRAEDLADESWVVLPGGARGTLTNRMHTLALNSGFAPKNLQTAPDSWTIMVLVGARMGVSLTLSSVREHTPAPGVVFRPLAPEPDPVEVRMIWRRGDRSAALAAVVDISRTTLPDPAPSGGTP
ncbi:LysR family transcriptional regulator [Zhihengliuella halotolerans]|uniref:LysR family transcriptional regulator n=1 Tax=Zhihengliuella halotolerans TaxID=370736 RepID=A0A4Q8AEZ9_9MICC|nr:LysR family transcriptional regulator [Zhihengliuella halotolerans]RZU62870.1 LysR family transcriptional regulator [Zhihengliuella halotolerans]